MRVQRPKTSSSFVTDKVYLLIMRGESGEQGEPYDDRK